MNIIEIIIMIFLFNLEQLPSVCNGLPISPLSDSDPVIEKLIQRPKFLEIRCKQFKDYLSSHFEGKEMDSKTLKMIDNLIATNLIEDLQNPQNTIRNILEEEIDIIEAGKNQLQQESIQETTYQRFAPGENIQDASKQNVEQEQKDSEPTQDASKQNVEQGQKEPEPTQDTSKQNVEEEQNGNQDKQHEEPAAKSNFDGKEADKGK